MHDIAAPCRWQLENRSPAAGTIEIAGWDFGGAGPLALLHHANGMCGALWAKVAVPLSSHFRVIAVDARGHGDSGHPSGAENYDWHYFVEDLVQVAQQILADTGQSQIALGLGSSFGGIVTAGAEAASNGLFARIMMLDPPIHATPELVAGLGMDIEVPDTDDRDKLVAQTLRRRSVWASRDEARDAWAEKPLFAAWDKELFALYLDEGMGDQPDGTVALKCPPEVEAHIFATTGSLGPLDYAPHIHVPTRLVHGKFSMFRLELYQGIASAMAQGEAGQLAGGHMLPLEVPDLVIDEVLEWTGC